MCSATSACGRRGPAARLYARSLAMKGKLLGRAHPDVAMTLNNFAMLRLGQGRRREARSLLLRAARIFERAYGPAHPHARAARENLALAQSGQEPVE